MCRGGLTVGGRRRCIPLPAQGREPLLLPAGQLHPSAAPRGASSTGDGDFDRPRLAGSMETRAQPASTRTPSPATEQLD